MKLHCNRITKFLIFATSAIYPAIVNAQIDDEELFFGDMPSVFTASKYEQKMSDAPAKISVITAQEIERYGYRTLSEALNSLAGIQLSYDHSYSYLGVRGLNIPGDFNSRVLILIDGHRINENIYDGSVIDYGAIVNIDMVKQIEMLRGPASSLYGSSAFLGVVNIITKDGRDLDGVHVSAETGSDSTNKARISYGEQFNNGLEVLASVSGFRTEGEDRYFSEYDDPSTNNGLAEDTDAGENDNALLKLNYGDWSLASAYTKYNKEIPTAAYETLFNDNRSNTTEGHSYLNLTYQTLLENGLDITSKLYYDHYWYDGDYIYDGAGDPNYLYIDAAKGDWWGLETQINKVLFDSHRITSGFEYRHTLKAKQLAFDVYETYLDIDTTLDVYGIYVQDEWQVNENLILNFGIRYDDYSNSSSKISPRLAGIWQNEETVIKLLYGSAFRAPNAYELFYDDGIAQKPALTLEPEVIESYELIWEQQVNSSIRLVTSIYHNDIKNMLVLVTDPVDGFEIFSNSESIKSIGAELELLANFSSGWSGSLSYAYQKTEDSNDKKLSNSAPNMIKLNALSPLIAESILLGFELQYEGSRKTLLNNEVKARTLANVTLVNNNLVDGLSLSAGIYNLFDQTYAHLGFQEHIQDTLEQNGLTYRLKLTYQF